MSVALEKLRGVVEEFRGKSVVVLGDLMLDEYVWGRTSRISPEAPVMVVDVERESSVPGGAANVVNNLLALGAKVSVVGVIGDDAGADTLRRALIEENAEISGLVVDTSRPTTRKTRIVAHNQQVLRVDREQMHAVNDEISSSIIQNLRALVQSADALVISDYNKGVVTPGVARDAVEIGRAAGIPVTANPKPASSAWLSGASVLQLNQSEAIATATRLGMDVEVFAGRDEFTDTLGADLRNRLGIDTLLVTRGARGMTLWSEAETRNIPPHPVEVYDSAGAGDTVIGTLTLGLAAGADVHTAAVVANYAAACVVRKLGVATITPDELFSEWS
jgi:D-beta-D-heptose 7-phosphate kinase/D-beta-D-heptose 1-phosphate adenosyltransferase